MAQIAWLGKKSPFCGNVSYGLTTTELLRERGHQTHFIHFDNPRSPERGSTSLLANDPDVSLPYLVKSQVYTIPSPGAQRELRESLERIRPDVVHASLTLSPLISACELYNKLKVPLVATFHPPFDAGLRNLTAGTQQLTYQLYAPFLARYDRVIVFSQLQADVLVRLGVPRDRLAVIPNGVDQSRWTPMTTGTDTQLNRQVRQRLAPNGCPLHGTHCHRKNVEALLRAWRLSNPRAAGWSSSETGRCGPPSRTASAQRMCSGGGMNQTRPPEWRCCNALRCLCFRAWSKASRWHCWRPWPAEPHAWPQMQGPMERCLPVVPAL